MRGSTATTGTVVVLVLALLLGAVLAFGYEAADVEQEEDVQRYQQLMSFPREEDELAMQQFLQVQELLQAHEDESNDIENQGAGVLRGVGMVLLFCVWACGG